MHFKPTADQFIELSYNALRGTRLCTIIIHTSALIYITFPDNVLHGYSVQPVTISLLKSFPIILSLLFFNLSFKPLDLPSLVLYAVGT